ncbi:MAG: hypothetical protein RL490_2656, partial [Pseudomonadota bacterium]
MSRLVSGILSVGIAFAAVPASANLVAQVTRVVTNTQSGDQVSETSASVGLRGVARRDLYAANAISVAMPGGGSAVTLDNQSLVNDDYYRGGLYLPFRSRAAMTQAVPDGVFTFSFHAPGRTDTVVSGESFDADVPDLAPYIRDLAALQSLNPADAIAISLGNVPDFVGTPAFRTLAYFGISGPSGPVFGESNFSLRGLGSQPIHFAANTFARGVVYQFYISSDVESYTDLGSDRY